MVDPRQIYLTFCTRRVYKQKLLLCMLDWCSEWIFVYEIQIWCILVFRNGKKSNLQNHSLWFETKITLQKKNSAFRAGFKIIIQFCHRTAKIIGCHSRYAWEWECRATTHVGETRRVRYVLGHPMYVSKLTAAQLY